MHEDVLLRVRDGAVLRATLNRPAKRNALNGAVFAALEALIADCAQDRSLRGVVLAGAGGHFCAGLDLAELVEGEAALARNRRMGAILAGLSALPQVVIAQITGAAHAGGLGLACAADLVFASADARFAAPETRRGLVAAQILPWIARRTGRSEAARLVLQAHVVGAAEAARIGLVHAVAEDAAALATLVDQVLADVLQGAPEALAETKILLAALGPVVPEGYGEAGAQAFAKCAAGGEAAEGILAFREKRLPAWAAR
ncbi:MAG: enoyl-CoA hydratase/isomerase [Rhodospirillales bacterium]|nr:enoyl-CoA hydratase/isomerase [Rhodospirillales bacterium]